MTPSNITIGLYSWEISPHRADYIFRRCALELNPVNSSRAELARHLKINPATLTCAVRKGRMSPGLQLKVCEAVGHDFLVSVVEDARSLNVSQ